MNMQAVGAYLQEQRKASGLTQEEVGHRLGVAGRTVSDWESGRYVPNFERMARLVRLIGGDIRRVTQLFLGEPDIEERTLIEWADTEEKRTILLHRISEMASDDPELRKQLAGGLSGSARRSKAS
jgi:transcriptional regulator with XRE-family HTH domain